MHQITTTGGVLASHLPEQFSCPNDTPVLVCCGVGVDSTAMLIGLNQRGIRPDLITFADTGSEKPDTYLYVPVLRQWLRDVGFPDLVVVRNGCPRSEYESLYGNCQHNETLPSLAFGGRSCSLRWKYEPQEAFRRRWPGNLDCWDRGRRSLKLIGFDATETHRSEPRRTTYSEQTGDTKRYDIRYPLQDWGWNRRTCERVIADAGLPVPAKSACFICPASRRQEVLDLPSDLYQLSVDLEEHYRNGKHWRGDAATTVGLGRKWRWSTAKDLRQLTLDLKVA